MTKANRIKSLKRDVRELSAIRKHLIAKPTKGGGVKLEKYTAELAAVRAELKTLEGK